MCVLWPPDVVLANPLRLLSTKPSSNATSSRDQTIISDNTYRFLQTLSSIIKQQYTSLYCKWIYSTHRLFLIFRNLFKCNERRNEEVFRIQKLTSKSLLSWAIERNLSPLISLVEGGGVINGTSSDTRDQTPIDGVYCVYSRLNESLPKHINHRTECTREGIAIHYCLCIKLQWNNSDKIAFEKQQAENPVCISTKSLNHNRNDHTSQFIDMLLICQSFLVFSRKTAYKMSIRFIRLTSN